MNSAKLLAKLLLENSTAKFNIEYNIYLFNHIAHGIIALDHLGATETRMQRFIDWYTPRLEMPKCGGNKNLSQSVKTESDKDERNELVDQIKTADIESLKGTRKSFYKILDHYELQLSSTYKGSIDEMITGVFPKLCRGIVASALHGLIHIGYGYAAKVPR